jgi:hypothetical protein
LALLLKEKIMKRYRMILTLFFGLLVFQLAVQAADTRTVDTAVSASMKMVNVVQSSSTKSTNASCYIHFFYSDNFKDTNHIVYGPGKWSNLQNLPGAGGVDWEGEIGSFKIGPTATVRIWEDKNFHGNSQILGPGTEIANFDDALASIKITCR